MITLLRTLPRLSLTLVAALSLGGCAGTFIADPPARSFLSADEGQTDKTQTPKALQPSSIDAVFSVADEPVVFELCDASPEDTSCVDKTDNPSGGGVGGLFIPLFLTVDSMEVTSTNRVGGDLVLAADFEAYVNGIPPLCDDTEGKLERTEAGSFIIEFDGFYCNWLAIGNVISQFKMSIDRVDVEERKFAGYYSFRFNGTGNAGGSGYYIAYIASEESQSDTEQKVAAKTALEQGPKDSDELFR